MKTCSKCNVEKGSSEFYAHSGMRDGRLNECKVCCRDRIEKRRLENIEHVMEYDRNRPNKKERSRRQAERLRNDPEAAEKSREWKREWANRNQDKRHCHHKVHSAIRRGELSAPSKCESCMAKGKTEAHHDDYSKPLMIRWLCGDCHRAYHKKQRQLSRDSV